MPQTVPEEVRVMIDHRLVQILSDHKLKLRTYPVSTAIELYGYPNPALHRMIYEGLTGGKKADQTRPT